MSNFGLIATAAAIAATVATCIIIKTRQPKFIALRLRPQTEIKQYVANMVKQGKIRGGGIVSCVGSTSHAVLRLANAAPNVSIENCSLEITKPMEIVSLSGTLSKDGLHLHISLADENGQVVGGHLVSATVHTTCELILIDLPNFTRTFDASTGFNELQV